MHGKHFLHEIMSLRHRSFFRDAEMIGQSISTQYLDLNSYQKSGILVFNHFFCSSVIFRFSEKIHPKRVGNNVQDYSLELKFNKRRSDTAIFFKYWTYKTPLGTKASKNAKKICSGTIIEKTRSTKKITEKGNLESRKTRYLIENLRKPLKETVRKPSGKKSHSAKKP